MSLPSELAILDALRKVIDPDFQRDIVDLGFVQNLRITIDGVVTFDLVLTTPACPVKDRFVAQCKQLVGDLPGVSSVDIVLKASTRRTNSTQATEADGTPSISSLAQVSHILGIASGKGGVGKSTVTANLAMALSLSGAKVGVLDADIHGPSMVLMFGITEDPIIHEDRTLTPATAPGGIKVVSMAMFADASKATIWRGPMASQMIQNFLLKVHWGELDYLLIDFPPGTGDIQLTLTQHCPLSGAIIVTTPQEVSLADARKGLAMFDSVQVPVLGIVENMSYFICDNCEKKHFLFRQGGGARLGRLTGVPLLGQIPIEPMVADSGDLGNPVVRTHPNSESGRAFLQIAGTVAAQLSLLSEETSFLQNFDFTWDTIPLREIDA